MKPAALPMIDYTLVFYVPFVFSLCIIAIVVDLYQ